MLFDSQKNPAAMQGDGSMKHEPAGAALQLIGEKPFLVSTDGRGAICIAAQCEPSDVTSDAHHSACYHENVFCEARVVAETDLASVIFTNDVEGKAVAMVDGSMAFRSMGAMPDVAHVAGMHAKVRSTFELSIDARRLERIQKGLNATYVTLKIPLRRDGSIDRAVPIRVEPTAPTVDGDDNDGSFGLLMPVCAG